MTSFACPFWLINSGLCSWTSHSTEHGDILAGNSPQNKITIHFPQGSLAAVPHLAVNQDSTKMRHSWTQWQTTAAPHSTTIGFTQGHCKKTASLIYFSVNNGFTPSIASGWRGVLTMHWTLSMTIALDFTPLPSANIQKGYLKHLWAWKKIAFAPAG